MTQFEHLRVGDLARLTGKTSRTLHYYEELGLLTPCQRTAGGFRLYAPDAPQRVEFIDHLKDLGFSLEQIADILRAWQAAPRDEDASSRLHGILDRARDEARKKRLAFEALEDQIAVALRKLDRGVPEDRVLALPRSGRA